MIRSIGLLNQLQQTQKPQGPATSTAEKIAGGFSALFDEVNQEQLKADQMISEMVAGTNKDIPATMVAMEKAETSLRMLMAVRNKMISAYEEISRMPV